MLRSPRVLVTRPQGQAQNLLARLAELGFEPIHFPTIHIIDTHDRADNVASAKHVNDFDLLIFISQNAVDYGLRLLQVAGYTPPLPPTAAIGQSTRALLEKHSIAVSACPAVPQSKTLLEMDAIKALPPGSRVLIFRGCGGKETLAMTLRERGMEVVYAEVYQRAKPPESLALGDPAPDIVMATSADGLQNLFEMTEADSVAKLLNTPVIMGSQAMKNLHTSLGFKQPPVMAASPLDDDMIAAAVVWRQTY